MLKKITFFIVSFCLLNSNLSIAQDREPVGDLIKNFNVLLSYGNLTGIGIGFGYSINKSIRINLYAGLEAPGYIIWPAPYKENQWNIKFAGQWIDISGFYLGGGIFMGSYDLSKLYDDNFINASHNFWEIAPTLSLGYEYPKKIFGKIYGIECGLAYNISDKYSKTEKNEYVTYNIEAKRSLQSMGKFYPFFIITIKF